jgi:hypothetical protein
VLGDLNLCPGRHVCYYVGGGWWGC